MARLWIELGRKSESQDTFIRLIIVERIIKAVKGLENSIGFLQRNTRSPVEHIDAAGTGRARGRLVPHADKYFMASIFFRIGEEVEDNLGQGIAITN